MQFEDFIGCLQCPECAEPLEFTPVGGDAPPAPETDGRFGVLRCGCSAYPVLADIPVLMHKPLGLMSHWNDGAVHQGPMPEQIVSLLEQGNWREALVQALIFPRTFPGHWRFSGKPYWPTWFTRRAGLAATRRDLEKLLFQQRDQLTIKEWTDLFFAKRSGNNDYLADYFASKITMPRFLSAMSLVQRLPQGDGPVVDMACGMGHLARFLSERSPASQVIGMDINFYHVWAARHLIARQAWFICADFGATLPVGSGRASAVTCSDAFQYLPDKPKTMSEIERIAPGKPVIVARVGALGVGPANPPTGGELTAEGYLNLFGPDRTRVFADVRLWKDYLTRRDPLAAPSPSLDDLIWEKYLSFVIHPEALGPLPPETQRRPHGLGRLMLNPMYRVTGSDNGGVDLEFGFNSIWGAYEDADMAAYVQKWVRLEPGRLEKAIQEPESESARDLVERFVLIGAPD